MSIDTRAGIKAIVADLKTYIEKKIELTTLEAQDKGAVLAAAIMSNVLGIALLLIGGFLLLFAAAIGLGYLFNNMALGFLALASVFVLVGTYIYKTKRNALKKNLERQIAAFIENVFQNPDSNEPANESKAPGGAADLKAVRENDEKQRNAS